MTSLPPIIPAKRDPYAGDDAPPQAKGGPWGSRCPQAREFSLKLLGALRDGTRGRPDAKWGAAKRMRSSDRDGGYFNVSQSYQAEALPFGVELEPKEMSPLHPSFSCVNSGDRDILIGLARGACSLGSQRRGELWDLVSYGRLAKELARPVA